MWGKDHGIDGFPTLKLYRAGAQRAEEGTVYSNMDKDTAHTMVGLSAFIGHHHRAMAPGSDDDDDSEVPHDDDDVTMQEPEPKQASTTTVSQQHTSKLLVVSWAYPDRLLMITDCCTGEERTEEGTEGAESDEESREEDYQEFVSH